MSVTDNKYSINTHNDNNPNKLRLTLLEYQASCQMNHAKFPISYGQKVLQKSNWVTEIVALIFKEGRLSFLEDY